MILRRNTCRHLRDQLPLHVGNDLDPAAAERVDAHLKSCLSCFREFRELAAMRGRLGVLAEQPLPAGILDGFTEEVMARIAIGEPGPAAEPPVPARVLRPFAWQRVAAAAAVVLVAISAWRLLDDPTGARPMGGPTPAAEETRVAGNDGAADRAAPFERPGQLSPQPAFEAVPSPGLRSFGGAMPVSAGASQQQQVFGVPEGIDPHSLPGLRLPSEADRMIIFRVPVLAPNVPLGSGLEIDAPRQPRLREP